MVPLGAGGYYRALVSRWPETVETVHRSFAHRLTALLALLVFLFGWTGEALGQHACPHHDMVQGAAAMSAKVAMHHGGGHAMHHGAPDASMRGGGAPAPHSAAEHDACTCQGTCPSAFADAAPARADATPRVVPAAICAARADEPRTLPQLLSPFFLPYGQAPPSLG